MPDAILPPTNSKSPAFQFYPRDFIADANVLMMDSASRGCYIMLLSVCWLEGSLPTDDRRLARLAMCPEAEWAGCREDVLACFAERDGRYYHKRLDLERQKQAEFIARQSYAGKKSAERRLTSGCPPVGKRLQPKSKFASASASSFAVQIPTVSESAPRTRPPSKAFVPHKGHALCGRVCLPVLQFREFVRLKGGSEDDAGAYVSDWARRIIADLDVGGARATEVVGETFAFWREQWKATHHAPRAGLTKTAGNAAAIQQFLKEQADVTRS